MNVDSAQFEVLAEPPVPEWVMRVTAKGSGFATRAVPLGAQLGDVPVEGLVIDLDAAGFTGYLRRIPPSGSRLLVGYRDGELADTGITFDPPNA
jgi:hypothetical protein